MNLNPVLLEPFKSAMEELDWSVVHQDAGQTHFVGWGYEIAWQSEQSQVMLRYFNKQGEELVFLEMTPCAKDSMQQLITRLNG